MRKCILPCAAGFAWLAMAQSVTSVPAKVRGPGNAFDPIYVSAESTDASRFADTTNVFEAVYTEDFTVDGDVGKSVWRKAKPIARFLSRRGEEVPPDSLATDVRMMYSATAIYVGATLCQPMDTLRAQYDQDDQPVYNDDAVEMLLLVPSGRGENMLHLAVNALGSCFDERNGRTPWNAKGRTIRTRRQGDRWMLEMKLPYAGLGIDRPIGGDFLGVRFCRTVHNPRKSMSSPKMTRAGNNGRHSLAKLVFVEAKGTAAAEARAHRDRIARERALRDIVLTNRRLAQQELASGFFGDMNVPVYNHALQAVNQMKSVKARFDKGAVSTNDFVAYGAGFRKFAAENAYAVWPASLWEKGDPERMPPENCAGLPLLKFEQAGNEREAVCLEFTGLLCGPRLDLRIVPQSFSAGRGKKSRFVSCDAFEVYEEPFIQFEKELLTAPLVRRAGNIVTLTPGKTTRVWIMFNSRGVAPGDYQMKIRLKPAYDRDVVEKTLEANVRVWNFTLPETKDWPFHTFFWGPNFFDNDETHMLKLMHDHHVTHGWTKSYLYTFGIHRDSKRVRTARKGEPLDFDPKLVETANEEFFRTAKDLGMRFVFGWGTPKKVEWFRLMDKRLRGMGFKPGDYIFKSLLKDEFVKHHIPTLAPERAAVTKEFGTNLWFQAVYLSTPPPTGATIDDIEEAKLPEFFRVWTVIDGVFRNEERGRDITRRLRSKGCKVWTYMCSRYMQRLNILNYYRFYLWRSYMRGLDGVAMWTSGGRGGDDGFDSRDGYDDGILWCGYDKKQVPTKRFEAFREGLEDIAYMDLLAKSIAKAKAKGRNVSEAQDILNAREQVMSSHDQKIVDEWRLAAGRMIDSLSK